MASPLHSYTGGRGEVEGAGATVAEVLADLDSRFPGIRRRVVDEQERIRPHMRIYVGTEPATGLDQPVHPGQEVHILQALSGGTLSTEPFNPNFTALDPSNIPSNDIESQSI